DVADIQRVLRGDMRAYAALVNRYQSMVFVLVRSVCRSTEDAQEITQDVFLKVYRQLYTFKGNASFRTWLYRIAYNTAISWKRKSKVREKAEDAYTRNEVYSARPADEEPDPEREEQYERLRGLVEELPPQEKMLIELYYYKDLKMEEVAYISGMTLSNAKVRIFRIRQKLQQAMTQA
ncbi:MAG TPA: RNA polymerase sigma factor, partial [Bacteroidales bacterium]|nr:RNA polymerase sigma factor [Bacteroidales bacterium]